MHDIYEFVAGSTPLLVSNPHSGMLVPAEIKSSFTGTAQALPDTDWHLDALYGFVAELGAAHLTATHSRYVVDLNRPPDDERLYSTTTTGLFPVEQFDGMPIYRDGQQPDAAQIASRMETYYRPYHAKLTSAIEEIKGKFGFAVLFDTHSIRSRVPRLFDGVLPELCIGTNDNRSANQGLIDALVDVCDQSPFSTVLNGRFKGGYITRHYGDPMNNVHAIQIEMPQNLYMQEDESRKFDRERAARLLPTLKQFVDTMMDWQPA